MLQHSSFFLTLIENIRDGDIWWIFLEVLMKSYKVQYKSEHLWSWHGTLLSLCERTLCYILDVLWGHWIKQHQEAPASELLENQWNNCLFFKNIPLHYCRASEASKIDFVKNQIWKVWTKIFNSSLKNGYFGTLIFQEIDFFEH